MIKKLISINSLFIIYLLFATLEKSIEINEIRSLFGVSSNIKMIIETPWVIITYMFTHLNFFHFFTNMFFLYVFGKIFLKYLSNKKLISNYIIGGICGAFFFLVFSYVNIINIDKPLIGASASILSILASSITFTPNYSFKIYKKFDFTIKLKYIAITFIIYSILHPILSNNIGGLIAHVGGLFYGTLYIFFLKKNINLAYLIEKLFEINFLKNNKRKIRSNEDDYEYNTRKKIEEIELNKILEKISHSGYKSLSKKEKRILKEYSQN